MGDIRSPRGALVVISEVRYIRALKDRITKLEALLRRVCVQLSRYPRRLTDVARISYFQLHPGESFPELGDSPFQPTTNPLLVARTATYPVDSLIADFEAIRLDKEQRFFGQYR